MKKKILFVLRSYNDIDHFTPIIHFLHYSNLFQIKVCTFRKKHEIDTANLEYLENKLNIKVFSFIYGINSILEHIYSLFIKLKKFDLSNKFLQLIINYLAIFIEKIFYFGSRKKIFKKIDQMFKEYKPDIICFDYILPTNTFYFYTAFKREQNTTLLSLPHGIMIFNEFSNNLDRELPENIAFLKKNKKYYDCMVSINNMNTYYLMNSYFIEQSKTKILGSLRFSEKWLQIKDKDFKSNNYKKNYDICIFLNKLMYKGNVSNIIYLLETISSFKNLSVAIKPHTRNMKKSFLKKFIKNKNFYFVDDIPSSYLIKNSNLFIFWGTSIGFEVIQRNKKFINTSFCHDYTTVYDDYFPHLSINDRELMKKIIEKYTLNPHDTFFTYDKRSFVKEIINGSDNLPVDQKYINFFNNLN